MKGDSFKLSNGINTFYGKMVIGNEAMYFLCASKGSSLLEGARIGLGFCNAYKSCSKGWQQYRL